MEEFMEKIAPTVWPLKERTGIDKFIIVTLFCSQCNAIKFTAFCYMARGQGTDCNAKEGNPFGPFWDTFNVDFVKSEFYGPLNYDVHHQNMAAKWSKQYPPQTTPGELSMFTL